MYYILDVSLTPDDKYRNSRIFLIYYSSYGSLLYLVQLILIVEVSCALSNESSDMIVRIYKLANATEHDNMKRKLRDFAMQWASLPMKFTCYGIFEVDRTLYLMVGN